MEKEIPDAPKIEEKALQDMMIDKKGPVCVQSTRETINFKDAQPDPYVHRIIYDIDSARYLFDIFDMMTGEKFKEESEASWGRFVKDGETHLKNN